ncbi:MAG: hypothetical protein KIG36_03190 [Eubacteriales bacterium]|nr:hypothetical protein [Eubacteriales bacterium]
MVFLFSAVLAVLLTALFFAFRSFRVHRELTRLDEVELRISDYSATELAEKFGSENHIYAQMNIRLREPVKRIAARLKTETRSLRDADRAEREALPAVGWLLDNAGLFEDELRAAARSFARVRLPAEEGIPRVLLLGWLLTEKYDGSVDLGVVRGFLETYSSYETLTDSELWMLPAAIRLCCCLKAERVAADTLRALEGRRCAARLLRDPLRAPLRGELCETARALSEENARLVRRLGTTCREAAVLAADAASLNRSRIAFAVTTLRGTAAADWETLCTDVSGVERLYAAEKCGVYLRMDAESRAYCRKRTARWAEKARTDELSAAAAVVALADERGVDVCEILFGRYEEDLRARLGLRRRRRRDRSAAYITTVVALWLILAAAFTAPFVPFGFWTWSGALGLGLMLCGELAVRAVQAVLTRWYRPRFLPKIKVDKLTEESSAVVIMPSVLSEPKDARAAAEKLEMYFLTNCLPGIRFVLLGDYPDSSSPTAPGDEAVRAEASRAVRDLCARHGDVFFYLQRARRYHEADGVYSAWERKRGSLMDFTRLIVKGESGGVYDTTVGDVASLKGTRYILTLDSDTALTADSAGRLIGAALHPMNRAVLSEDGKRVLSGYTIFAPRVGVSARSAVRTRFSLLFSDQFGLDAYSSVSSDLYMDGMGEANYGGKGLYDARAFYAVLADLFPDDLILSHDLIEGCFTRTALVSDVRLFDSFPSSFMSWSRRQNRWIRGDWQIAGYLFPRICDRKGARLPNPLSPLSKWKVFDNLRRSVLPFETVRLLLLGPLLLPLGFLSFGLAAAVWVLPPLLRFLREIFVAPAAALRHLAKAAVDVLLLPYYAYNQIDATGRSLYRVLISHKKCLEWVTSDASERQHSQIKSLVSATAPVLAVIFSHLLICSIISAPAFFLALPLDLVWLSAPLLMLALDGRPERAARDLTEAERRKLGMTMALTWRYFEETDREAFHHLPPDNWQVYPDNGADDGLADRTTPTNIGLTMAACVAALDRGYLCQDAFLDRIEQTAGVLRELPKWHGHLYNWYRPSTLEVLSPPYVSTVDSGNFCAYLLVAAAAVAALPDRPPLPEDALTGFADEARLLGDETLVRDLEKARTPAERFTALEYLASCAHRRIADRARAHLNALLTRYPRLRTETPAEEIPPARTCLTGADEREARAARTFTKRCEALSKTLLAMFTETDFSVLRSRTRGVFLVGINTDEVRRDNGACYDLMAGEARQTDYIAIAKGDVPQKQWFRLSTALTETPGGKALLSWSGTAFEYWMPTLVLPTVPETVFAQTMKTVVREQIRFGRRHGIPWGISESGYFAFDRDLNYQYRAFGIPSLSLRPDEGCDLVAAPYATFLALPFAPAECLANLARLESLRCLGDCGFYEALDCTPERVGAGKAAVIRSYMTHHQGMILLALDNCLGADAISRYFFSYPFLQAQRLLLEENSAGFAVRDRRREAPVPSPVPVEERRCRSLRAGEEGLCLLSNGRLRAHVTTDGIVTLWYDGLQLNLPTRFLPSDMKGCTAVFSEESAAFEMTPDGETLRFRAQMAVDGRQDAFVMRLSLTNRAASACSLRLEERFSPVLDDPRSYRAHPAFSTLFLSETQPSPDGGSAVFRRVRRGEKPIAAAIRLTGAPAYRTKDFGVGTYLELEGGSTRELFFVVTAARTAGEATRLAGRFSDEETCRQSAVSAADMAPIRLAGLGVRPYTADRLASLAHRINDKPLLSRDLPLIANNGVGKLYGLGIGGEYPILLAEAAGNSDLAAEQILQAYLYYADKGIVTDAVILCRGEYFASSAARLRGRVEAFRLTDKLNVSGGVHLIGTETDRETADFLRAAAVLVCD